MNIVEDDKQYIPFHIYIGFTESICETDHREGMMNFSLRCAKI